MLPNFFVVGAEKAGTTSMHRYLDAHPQVYMSPVKEPMYFAIDPANPPPVNPDWPYTQRIRRDLAAYEELFDGVTTETAFGEASTAYLQSDRAATQIRVAVPDARILIILIILRDPSARAYSAFTMYKGRGLEPINDFEEAIDTELDGGNWRAYVNIGFYSAGVSRYLDHFGSDRVTVLLNEDLRERPRETLRDTYAFLGVDRSSGSTRASNPTRRSGSTSPRYRSTPPSSA